MSAGLLAVQWAASALFLFLWAITGWGDFKTRKIRNRSLRAAAAAVGAGYLVLLATTGLGIAGRVAVFPYWGYYGEALSAVAACAAAALGLWWLGVWPAGDAKLFILLAALYPLTNIFAAGGVRLLFLSALINAFLPACGAVFLSAGRHVLATRLLHRRHFLLQLGWKKELHFLLDSLRAGAAALAGSAASAARAAAAEPGRAVSAVAGWAAGTAVMSLISYALKGLLVSPLLFGLFWGGVFLLWNRLAGVLGAAQARALAVALGAGLLFIHPPAHWSELGRIFMNLSLFNLFLGLGASWAMTVLVGDAGAAYLVTAFLPVLVGGIAAVAATAAARAGSLAALPGRAALTLAGMGAFFGLSLALVRLWDREVLPNSIEDVSAYAVLAPGFVERLRQDPEFFAAHFPRLYADGLTPEQARAVRDWCARRGVEAIPLTPTISFAAWIFLGFFLSRMLGGGHVISLIL